MFPERKETRAEVQPEIIAVHLCICKQGICRRWTPWRFFHIAHALTPSRSCCIGLHAACRCRESRAPQRRERSVEKHHGSLSLSARLNARHQDASVVKEHQWRRPMSVSRRDVDLCAFFGRLFIDCDRLLGAGCLSCPEDSETATGEIPTRRAEEGRGREHQDTQVGHR